MNTSQRFSLTLTALALPSAFAIACVTGTSAQATQAPADVAGMFDPGVVCAGSTVDAPSITPSGPSNGSSLHETRVVIGAHAASLRLAR